MNTRPLMQRRRVRGVAVVHRALRALAAVVLVLAAATPGVTRAQIPSSEFAARRDSLAAHLDSGVVIAFGGRTPVTDFGPFYQLAAFRYLTNYLEPDAALVVVVRGGRPTTTLFVTPIEARRAMYYGRRPDSAAIARTLGLTSRPITALAGTVDSLVATALPVYQLADVEDADFARQDSLTRGSAFVASLVARHPGLAVRDAVPLVDVLRARKSDAEVALLRRAAQVSSAGHRAAMRVAAPAFEYELQAALESTFLRLGGTRPAYGSIVGAGEHSTQLHYMRDRGAVGPADLVVMDAATEYEGYAADVTRTIPASGTYTPAQRAIYQLVRDAQAAAERNARPGRSATVAQDSSTAVRAAGLARLGLIDSVGARMDPPWPADCTHTPQQCRQSQLWMIHGISHGLGLAVHDPAQFYTGDHTYRSGDAFTIEPGIYVSRAFLDALPDTPRNRAWIARVRPVVERYAGMGVRIEDDYVITPTGLERLSTAPRDIPEIEAWMRRRARPTP